MTDDDELRALGDRLLRGWPLGSDEVTDELRALVTAEEPARARALTDLALLVRAPRPFGFGLEVFLDEPPAVVTEAGRPVVHRLRLRGESARHMSGADVEAMRLTIERVVREPEGWRIHALFDERERADLERWLALLATARGG